MIKKDTDILIDVFSIPVETKPKQTRTPKVAQQLRDRGYSIEKDGREWIVWHNEKHPGEEAYYDRLSDINIENPV